LLAAHGNIIYTLVNHNFDNKGVEGDAENARYENAGMEKAGKEKYGKPYVK